MLVKDFSLHVIHVHSGAVGYRSIWGGNRIISKMFMPYMLHMLCLGLYKQQSRGRVLGRVSRLGGTNGP